MMVMRLHLVAFSSSEALYYLFLAASARGRMLLGFFLWLRLALVNYYSASFIKPLAMMEYYDAFLGKYLVRVECYKACVWLSLAAVWYYSACVCGCGQQ